MAKIRQNPLTQQMVKNIFDYRCGELIWKNCIHPKRNGTFAGCFCESTGYMTVGVMGEPYLIHQLIFLYHHGYIPKLIDHKDRNRVNNWIENLREADRIQNQANRSFSENGFKYKGVKESKIMPGKWECIFKKSVVGIFETQEDAAKEFNKWSINTYGEFGYVNRIII